MTSIFKVLAFAIILFSFTFLPSRAGWTNKGDYLEIQADASGISQILTPKDSNYFLVVDKKNYLRKYDFNGELLLDKILQLDGCTFLQCSRDGLTSAFLKTIGNKFYVLVKNNSDDSVIINKYLTFNYSNSNSDRNVSDFHFDYNSSTSIGISNYYVNANSWGSGFSSHHSESGSMNIYNKADDTLININDYYNTYFEFSNNYSFLLSNSYKYESNSSLGATTSYKLMLFDLIDINKFKLKHTISRSQINWIENRISNQINGLIPNYYKFATIDSIFIGMLDSSFIVYKFQADSVVIVDQITLNYHPNTLIFSPKNRNLILSSPYNTIDIFSLDTKTITKSIKLLDSLPCTILLLADDKKGFIAGNDKGAVKYFNVLTHIGLENIPLEDVNESQQHSLRTTVFPNPSNNSVEISFRLIQASAVRLRIFDMFGNQVKSINRNLESGQNSIKWNAENINPGIYFYRLETLNRSESGKIVIVK